MLVTSGDAANQRELRAYVYAEPGRAFHVDGSGTLQVYTYIGNSGKSFGKQVKRYVGMEVAAPTEDIASIAPMDREEGVLVLNPEGKIPIVKNWRDGQLNQAQYNQIQAGTLRIYVFGKITYEDVFDKKWQTDFCNAYYGPERQGFPGGDPSSKTQFGYESWQARPCEKGNDVKATR
jgi:hypothetical protein